MNSLIKMCCRFNETLQTLVKIIERIYMFFVNETSEKLVCGGSFKLGRGHVTKLEVMALNDTCPANVDEL